MAITRQQISEVQLQIIQSEREHQETKFRAEEERWLALHASSKKKAELEEQILLLDIDIKNKQLEKLNSL